MRFRNNVGLDPSQVQDVRGRGRMGGLPGGGLTVGGGGLGLVGIVIYVLLNVLSSGGLSGPLGNLDGSTVASQPPSVPLRTEARRPRARTGSPSATTPASRARATPSAARFPRS